MKDEYCLLKLNIALYAFVVVNVHIQVMTELQEVWGIIFSSSILLLYRFFQRLVLWSHAEKAMAPHSSTLAWKNPMDGGAWKAAVLGVTKSRTRLSDFTFTFHFHALENEMATHSNVLALRIPGMAEPGGLLSMGSQSWTRLMWLSSSSTSSSISEWPSGFPYFLQFESEFCNKELMTWAAVSSRSDLPMIPL